LTILPKSSTLRYCLGGENMAKKTVRKAPRPDKMAECFTPHAMMHSLFGLGLGLALVALVPGLNSLMLGVAIMVVAFVFDAMRK
jgi:hypothetical protein